MGYRMAKNRRPCAEGGFRSSYESGRKPTQRPNAGQGSTNPSGMPSLTLCRPDQVSAETYPIIFTKPDIFVGRARSVTRGRR
jgi:hypothetical protein